ncbi:MAG: hypothetical protein Q9163_003228 [Psora crenata]
MNSFALFGLLIFLSAFSPALAADCQTDQPRKEGDPSGQAISDALFGPGDATLQLTCGQKNTTTFRVGSLVSTLKVENAVSGFKHCQDAFHNIVQECVLDGNFWGGRWELDGETYTIFNDGWPKYSLPPPASSPTSSGAGIGTLTTITTTINNSPITQTFIPTRYTGVTSATTTTTNIGGVVVPLIIAAGGFAWIPFIPAGGSPPIPGVTPPPMVPGGPGQDNPITDDTPSTTSSIPSTSSAPSSSSRPVSASIEDYYVAGVCSFNGEVGGQTTTFTTKGKGSTSSRPSSVTSTTILTSTPIPLSESTNSPLPAQTTTQGCQVCTLIHGSLHPVCTPIAGCVESSTAAPAPSETPSTPTSDCHAHGQQLQEVIRGLKGDAVCTGGDGNVEVWDDGNSQITRYSFSEIYLILAKTTPKRGFPDE